MTLTELVDKFGAISIAKVYVNITKKAIVNDEFVVTTEAKPIFRITPRNHDILNVDTVEEGIAQLIKELEPEE